MTKRNYLIKILIYLLAAVFCFGMFGCFVGCRSDENGRENSLQFIYLQVSDNQGNRFYLGKDNTTHEKDLEYEYKLGDLKFTAEAYYESGEKCTQHTFISFRQNTIHLDEPGEYQIQQIYHDPDGGLDVIFKLNITVKEQPDTRPVPIIEILPDENCVSYEMNKRYVYRYNGERQRPKYFKVYDPDPPQLLIATLSVDGYAGNVELVKGDSSNISFVDVGIYKFDLYVHDPSRGIGGEYGHYAIVWIKDIVIEIIE